MKSILSYILYQIPNVFQINVVQIKTKVYKMHTQKCDALFSKHSCPCPYIGIYFYTEFFIPRILSINSTPEALTNQIPEYNHFAHKPFQPRSSHKLEHVYFHFAAVGKTSLILGKNEAFEHSPHAAPILRALLPAHYYPIFLAPRSAPPFANPWKILALFSVYPEVL